MVFFLKILPKLQSHAYHSIDFGMEIQTISSYDGQLARSTLSLLDAWLWPPLYVRNFH